MPIAGSVATVAGLHLTAESLAGRQNRIGTVMVQRTGPQRNPPPPGIPLVRTSGPGLVARGRAEV